MTLLSPYEFFDTIARRYDANFAPSHRETERDLREVCDRLGAGAWVLDLGAGTGRAWPHLIAAGAHVVAIDASSEMHAIASRRGSAGQVARVRGDLWSRWPVRDASCDAAVALHGVFAHPPPDAKTALAHVGRELRRCGRRGATIAIDVPDPRWVRAHLTPVGDDLFRHREPSGAEVLLFAPAIDTIIGALGIALEPRPSITGVRLLGALADAD
jgi:SAM-dependent methyltransferase